MTAIQLKRSATPGAQPGSLQAGELAINLVDGVLYAELDGGDVVAIGLVRTGEIVMAAVQPQASLLCDGGVVSRTTYARLFAHIGTTFGTGDGATTFNLPDRRNLMWRTLVAGSSAGMTLTTAVENNNFYIYI